MSASGGWGKHYASMYEGSMYGAGAEVFAVWGWVISHAINGIVELNPRLIGPQIGITADAARESIDYLCAPDQESRNPDHDGSRLIHEGAFTYRLVSHAVYGVKGTAVERREYLAKKQREHREKAKSGKRGQRVSTGSSTSTPVSVSSSSDQDPDPERATGTDVVATPSERASMYLNDPMAARLSLQPPEHDDAVVELCAAWERTWGVSVTIRGGMNDPRLRVILERLADGFSVAQLCDAISGSKLDDHILSNRRFQSLKTVLRDAETVDAHAAALKPAPSPAAKPFTFPEGVKFYPLSDAERLPLNPEHSG